MRWSRACSSCRTQLGAAGPLSAALATIGHSRPEIPANGVHRGIADWADPPRHHCTGVATAYEAGDGNGACLFGPSLDLMIAAMNTTGYETSRACGAYVLVRAATSKTIRVRITNECPLPCAHGQLDLNQEAFAELADLKVGRIPIT